MSDSENAWIPNLKQQLAERQITRRAFLRYSTLLGMSAGAAYLCAGKITGRPFAPQARAAEMPKGGTLKISMRCPEIASPHTYSWVFDSNNRTRRPRIPHQDRCGRHHAPISVPELGRQR